MSTVTEAEPETARPVGAHPRARWRVLLAVVLAGAFVASAGVEFVEGAIVIGHANFEPIRQALPEVHAALLANGVAPVTLRDVYGD